jgi:signal transduction histidine kinase/CheY-like chemotaxis protein
MTLTRRLLLAGWAISVPLACIALAICWAIMWPTYERFAEREARDRSLALNGSLARDGQNLEGHIADWAMYNGSYAGLATQDAEFLEDYTSAEGLARIGVDEIGIYDMQGRRLAMGRADEPNPERRLAPERLDIATLALGEGLDNVGSSRRFIDGHLVFQTASYVLRSDGSGAPRGVMVMWREFGPADIKALGKRFGLGLRLVAPEAAPPEARAATPRAPAILAHTDAVDHIYVPIMADGSAPIAYVQVENPRIILNAGRDTLIAVFVAFMIAATIAVFLYQFVVHAAVLRPIGQLVGAVSDARATGRFRPPAQRWSGAAELEGLSDSFARLMTQVEEREVALTAARERAEEAVWARSAFLATVSHEIRTPLNGVLGIAHILRRDERDPERQRMGQTIIDSGELLLHILNDVLDMAKIEAGKMEIAPVDFSLAALSMDAEALWRSRADEKGLSYTVTVDPALPARANADAMRLRQILFNLIGNAIKFTDTGSVDVAFTQPAPGRLRLSVRDTGLGIAPDQVERLFAAFEQADDHLSRAKGGTGLGLAISRRLADLMGADMGVDSALGKGSHFWLEAPIGEAAPELELEEFALDDLPDQTPLSVLVAEDNATNRLVALKLLEGWGCRAVFAEDGAQAVEAAGVGRYDLILMDLQMPVMDGLAAARAIRAGEGPNTTTPIVALTANAGAEDQAACRAAGMSGFIPKPIRPAALEAVLTSVRAQGAGRASPAGFSLAS